MTSDQPPLPELPEAIPLDTDAIPSDPSLPLSDQSDPLSGDQPDLLPDEFDEFEPSSGEPSVTAVTTDNQDVLSQLPPIIKAPAIKTLRSAIRGLEGIVTRLEAVPFHASKSPLGQSSTRKFAGQNVQQWWITLLHRVRSVLPEAVQQNLSDRALGGAIAGILLLVVWTTSSLLFQPSKPTPVAVLPLPSPATSIPDQATPTPIPTLPSPGITPSIEPNLEPSPEPALAPIVAPAPVLSPAPSVSDQLSGNPVPNLPPTVAPSPQPPAAPPLKLTPEQKLIAQIQDEVAEISNQYVNGLIQSVQANFRSSRLTVKLSDGWYNLPALQQDQLANDMLRRTQELDFSKLELTDATGVALARSPVVGEEMIILQRTTTTATTAALLDAG